jgi:hypothetical protein
MKNDDKILHVFIDESGNLDFSNSGTEYFVLAAASTFNPMYAVEKLAALKYTLNLCGYGQEFFHATEDRQLVRNLVFSVISSINDIEIDSVIAQKRKANPTLYREDKAIFNSSGVLTNVRKNNIEENFYQKLVQCLLQYLFKRHNDFRDTSGIIVYLGSLLTEKKRNYILKFLKPYLKQNFRKPFRIYFHQTKCDSNMQVADYCAWAIFVNLERNEMRPIKEIQDKIFSQFDIFQTGQQIFY